MNLSLVQKQIKLNLVREGVIFKRTKFFKDWAQQWMVLTVNFIFIFEDQSKKVLDSTIDLINVKSYKSYVRKDEEMIPSGFKIRSLDDMFYLCARSPNQKWSWIVSLERLMDFKHVGKSPFNNMEYVKTKGFMSQLEYQKGKFDQTKTTQQLNSQEISRLKKALQKLEGEQKGKPSSNEKQDNASKISKYQSLLQQTISKMKKLQTVLEQQIHEHKVTSKLLTQTFAKYQQTKKELLSLRKNGQTENEQVKTSHQVKVAPSKFVLDQIASFVGYHPSQSQRITFSSNYAPDRKASARQAKQDVEANKAQANHQIIKVVHYKQTTKAQNGNLPQQIQSLVGYSPSISERKAFIPAQSKEIIQQNKHAQQQKVGIAQSKPILKIIHYKSTSKASNDHFSQQIESFIGYSPSISERKTLGLHEAKVEQVHVLQRRESQAQYQEINAVVIKVVHYRSTEQAKNKHFYGQIESLVGYSPSLAERNTLSSILTRSQNLAVVKTIQSKSHTVISPQFKPSKTAQSNSNNESQQLAQVLLKLKALESNTAELAQKIKQLEKQISQKSQLIRIQKQINKKKTSQIEQLENKLRSTIKQLENSPKKGSQTQLKEISFARSTSQVSSSSMTSSPSMTKSEVNPNAPKVSELKKMFQSKPGQQSVSSVTKSSIMIKQQTKKKEQNMPQYRKQSILNLFEEFDVKNLKLEELTFIVQFIVKISSQRSYGYQAFAVSQAKNHANKQQFSELVTEFIATYQSPLNCDKIAKFIEVIIFEAPGVFKEAQMIKIKQRLAIMLYRTAGYQGKGPIIKTMYVIHKFKKYEKNAQLVQALQDFAGNKQTEENKSWAKKLIEDLNK